MLNNSWCVISALTCEDLNRISPKMLFCVNSRTSKAACERSCKLRSSSPTFSLVLCFTAEPELLNLLGLELVS